MKIIPALASAKVESTGATAIVTAVHADLCSKEIPNRGGAYFIAIKRFAGCNCFA